MGLEFVEVVLDVEEKFGIRIDDAAAAKFRTAGDLRDYIATHAAAGSDAVTTPVDLPVLCLTSVTFFRLRRAITAVLPAQRRAFRPAANLDDVLPPRLRREAWPQLAKIARLPLPPLRRPPATVGRLAAIVAGTAACTLASAVWIGRWGWEPTAAVTALTAVVVGGIAWLMTEGLRTLPLGRSMTVGEFVRIVAEMNLPQLRRETGIPPSKDEIWRVVRQILADAGGLDLDEIHPESSLVGDLGLD